MSSLDGMRDLQPHVSVRHDLVPDQAPLRKARRAGERVPNFNLPAIRQQDHVGAWSRKLFADSLHEELIAVLPRPAPDIPNEISFMKRAGGDDQEMPVSFRFQHDRSP